MSDKDILKAIWCHIKNVGKENYSVYKVLNAKSVISKKDVEKGVHFFNLKVNTYENFEKVGTTFFFFPKKRYVTKKYITGIIVNRKDEKLSVYTEDEELVREYEEKLDLLLKEEKEEEEKKKKEFLNNLLC